MGLRSLQFKWKSDRPPYRDARLWPMIVDGPGTVVWAVLFLMLLALPHQAPASNQVPAHTKNQDVSADISPDSLDQRIRDVNRKLANAVSEENPKTARKLGITLPRLQGHTAILRDLEAVYQRLNTAFKKKASLEKEEALLQEKSRQESAQLSTSPPFSLSFYDTILNQLSTIEHRRETAQLASNLANRALEEVKARLDEALQSLRRHREKIDQKPDVVSAAENWELAHANTEAEFLHAVFALQKLAKQNLAAEIRVANLTAAGIRQNIAWVRKNIRFDKADLDNQLGFISRTRSELQKRLKEQLQRQIRVEAAWLQAQKKLTESKTESGKIVDKAALDAAEARRAASQKLLEQTEDMLQLLNQQEQAWKNRYALVQSPVSSEQLDAWSKTFQDYRLNIERSMHLQESYQASLQPQISALEKMIADPNSKAKLRQEFLNQLQTLRDLAEGGGEYLATLRATLLLEQRFLSEVALKREAFDLFKEFSDLLSKAREVWNLELWVIDEHAVTVKKLLTALLFLFIGLVFIKSFLLSTIRRLLMRTQLKETTTLTFVKITNYLIILLIVLFALRVVNIPLTLFTFLGGAVAIGLGFGAQNLINNFISSFIIMAERPIKIGDLIEIEGNFAMVEEIGARCTRIRTGANVHILVPNSSFLEKNIINWTLSDQEVRAQVTVGVIYGSPVRDVERIMLQVVKEHKRVNKTPEPFVLFNDFGDNALIFDIYFWISISRLMDRRIVESDIRFRLDELFREAGIVVAFPQRDIHLDTQRPLEFRLVNDVPRPGVTEKK